MTFADLERRLGTTTKGLLVAGSILLLGALATVDIFLGPELSASVFYLVPIVVITWYLGFGAGMLTAAAAALLWLGVDRYHEPAYAHTFAPYWNAAVRWIFFVVVAYLLARLQQELRREETLARTDPLTGLGNRRHLLDEAEHELHRAVRYTRPFTLAYVDVDDFKVVNDNFGHATGDALLREVAACFNECLRKPDVGARLGGDEFAVLLPETDVEGAHAMLSRLQSTLQAAMRRHAWPVTFSTGAVTFVHPPETVAEALAQADRELYRVKATGKNDLVVHVYRGPAATTAGPAARGRG